MDDITGTGRWLTYEELAKLRGIKRIGAVRLVQRHKWRRQAGNDGLARVLVPRDALEPVRPTDAGKSASTSASGSSANDDTGNVTGDSAGNIVAEISRAINALEAAVQSVTARAEIAEKRASDAENARDSGGNAQSGQNRRSRQSENGPMRLRWPRISSKAHWKRLGSPRERRRPTPPSCGRRKPPGQGRGDGRGLGRHGEASDRSGRSMAQI